MTRNPYDDNAEVLRAAELNALVNAHADEAVVSGCTPSKGTGDFDVDIASGQARVGDALPDVSAQTVALTSPANDADYDSGEERVDLVTVNSSGTASATEGTPASNPNSPDIPAGEALLARVHTVHSDTSLTASDIFDARALTRDVTTRTDDIIASLGG